MASSDRPDWPRAVPTLLGVSSIGLLIVLMLPARAGAGPQDANAAPAAIPASQDANAQEHPYNGDDATRPLNLLQLRYTYKTAPGTIRSVTTHTVTLRADRRIDLSPDWQLAFRTDLPTLAANPITSDNPEGHFRYGMGDAEFQAALIHDFNDRWAAGFGAKLIAPTGTDDLASRKWQVMPGASFRVMLPEIGPDSYFVPLVRYDLSVAGDRSAKDISNLQIAPTLNLDSQSLVLHVLSESRHSREFWRSCCGADRAPVSSVRCDGGSSAQKWLGRIARRQRTNYQGLPSL